MLALTGTAAGGLAGLGGQAAGTKDDVTVTDLGIPTPDLTTFATAGLDGKAYVTNRSGKPNVLGVFDLSSETVTDNYSFDGGVGSLAADTYDPYVFFTTYGEGEGLFRLDTTTGELTREWNGGWGYSWDIDVTADGKVYVGTYPYAEVYEYDIATREMTSLGSLTDTWYSYARTITATSDTIFVGTGLDAHEGIIAVDRETGEQENIMPDGWDSWTPTVLHTTDDWVIFQHARDEVAFLDRDNPTENFHSTTMHAYTVDGNTVYHAGVRDGQRGLWRYDPAARSHELVTATPNIPVEDLVQEGPFVMDGTFVGLRFEGKLITIDVSSDGAAQYDLLESGMRGTALTPQSISTYHEKPVVTAAGNLFVQSRSRSLPGKINAPGEAKAMQPVEQSIYLALYPSCAIAEYHVAQDEAEVVATIGENQLRPRDIHYQKATKSVLVGTRPGYGSLGGAVSAYDVISGDLVTHRNVVENQSVRSITSIGETAYIGSEIYGEKADPVAEEAVVAAWDTESQTVEWEMTPVPGKNSIAGLVSHDGMLYGVASGGTLFAVDPATRETVGQVSVGNTGEIEVGHDGMLYGAFGAGITRIDPETLQTETYASDVHAFNGELAQNDEGYLYAVDEDSYRLKKIDIDA